MATRKPKPPSPFTGRWRITHMDQWDQDFVDAEVEGYFEFDSKGPASFSSGTCGAAWTAG